MFVYIALYILLLLFSSCLSVRFVGLHKKNIKSQDLYLSLCFILFTVVMAFRSTSVGTDTLLYSNIFKTIATSDISSFWNLSHTKKFPLYAIGCKLISYVSTSPSWQMFITSLIVNLGLVIFIKRISLDVVISVFSWVGLTFFFASMNTNRQCIALVILLNASVYLSQNIKSRKGWILFALSVLIHAVSFCFVLPFLGILLSNKLKRIRKIFLISTIVSVIIGLLFPFGLKIILLLFPRYYTLYFGESASVSILSSNAQGRIIILYIFLLGLSILVLFKNENLLIANNGEDADRRCFAIRMIPTVVLCSVLGIMYPDNTLMNRILFYFMAWQITFIPYLLSCYKGINKTLLRIGIIVVLTLYSFVYLLENKSDVLYYTFVWATS